MGGFGIFGFRNSKAKPVYWMNLPGRNTVLELFRDIDNLEVFSAAILALCSERSCLIVDRVLLREVCKNARRFLKKHKDWTRDRKRVPADTLDWEWAEYYLSDFIKLTKEQYKFLVFYDNYYVHRCTWPERFSYVPKREDMIDDLRWGGQKEKYE